MTTTTNVLPGTRNGEIAFIDTSIAGYQTLLEGLREGVEAVLIDGAHDGVAQIAAALAGRSGIEAVHVFTHGAPGMLQLGATRLTESSLADHAADLGVLRSALAEGADLLLYGCDVAAGDGGESFLQALSAATGADVAASVDPSGSALLGGDWELEAATGDIEAHSALTNSGSTTFGGLLGITSEDFDGLGSTQLFGTSMTAGDWTFRSNLPTDMAIANGQEVPSYLNNDEGDPTGDRAVALNFGGNVAAPRFTMKSTDGTNFSLQSVVVGQLPYSASALTIVAYSNGVALPGVPIDLANSSSSGGITYAMSANDPGLGRYGTLTFSSDYADIDEIEYIFSNPADFFIDNIIVTPAVADERDPLITSVSVPPNKTYAIGETLLFTVTFDEDIIVSGTGSSLTLDVGSVTRNAAFQSAPTDRTIVYSYTVQSGDLDANGITINGLSLGTSTIRDAAGNPADLTLNNVAATAGVRVDGVAPAITGTITPPSNGTYVAGSHLDFTVTFDDNVTITGTSSTLELTIGTTPVSATHLSQTANSITYRHVVQAGNLDIDGIAIRGLTLPTGNAIRDAAGNNADVSLTGHLPSLEGVRVDAVAPAVLGNITAPIGDSYRAGEVLTFKVTFNENIVVTVGGAPSTLGLTIGSTARSASYVSSDANSVTYSYTVQAGDNDTDGIEITGLALNGGEIRDAAGNNADLALAGHLPPLDAVRVDTAGPVLTTATVDGNSMMLSFADVGALDATHPPALGDFTVTVAGETVTVTGVTVDASAKTVTLTLSTAVRNGQAVTVAYDDLTPNDADAIQDAVGNDAASFGVTPVVNNTPALPTNPPTNPPATGNTVDGVTLQIGTVVRSDGTVAQVVTVPIVTPSRQEQVGNNDVADIPLVKAADGSSLLAVQVPTGAGLQSIGNGAPKRAGDSLTDLIREIQAHTASGSHDQNQLTGGGGGFLDIVDADTQLLVQTIVLGGTGGTADVPLGIIGQPQQAGAVQSALVIDARSLSSAATIELQHVSFAAIIGAATVTGGAGNQHVWGDGSSQTIILGEGDDVLHGGAGDDIIGSGAGDDMIHGDEGDDLIFGGEGNDYLDGGAGHDTARFSGAVDGYSLRLKDGLLVMTDRAGNDGVDTVAVVEVLRFTGGQSMADDAVLARLYEGVLGRQASAAEVAWWQDVHVRGASLQQIAAAIIDSPEAAQAMGRADDDAFVAGLYQSVLGRTAPSAESAFWTDLLADGVDRATVALGFVNSAEKLASSLDVDFNHSDVAVLTRMYHAMFGRAPDEGGLNFWLERHEDGVSLGAIADEFIVSAEAQGLAGHGSDAAFIDQLFATALNRAPSSEERTLLLEQLQNGVYDRGQVLLDVSESEESIVIVGAINTSIDLL
ncbi:DUF4347 domain-containing protein [Massilia timonae]|uniref:DUF4347 domain-containing protein n=1 Tax=Massilia timonae TaxID=47229 RepID=UPI0023550DBA|nr:DUF4347 domain-containing protein [Massilia timonae]